MKDQSKKLWHVSNAFQIPEGETLAKKLCKKTFADYVMFQNSGAEATEAAIKVARRYFYSIGKKHKNRIICIKNSFHGRTIAAIHASGSKKMTEGFGPKVPGFDHFEFGDHKKLKKLINKNTAAIMIETVMGEGGIKVIPNWCIKAIRKICNQRRILLILDEVQCGIGRSGKFFAFEYANVKPDIVPIAKGIGGGFPIGAVLMTKKVAKAMVPGTHGSTFGGVSPESFGHYGYTGSMAWADPDKNIIFIFLSNRTYPTRENTLLQTSNTRTRSQEIVYKSLIDSEWK